MFWRVCPYDCTGLDWLDNDSEAVFWYRFAQKFDKVIILDRYDTHSKVVSALHAQYYKNWHENYEFKQEIIPPHKSMKEFYIKEEVSTELLKLLSRKLEVDITYCEELFNGAMRKNYFDLPIDNERLFKNYLDPKLKYRK